jgi:hypothetical protein
VRAPLARERIPLDDRLGALCAALQLAHRDQVAIVYRAHVVRMKRHDGLRSPGSQDELHLETGSTLTTRPAETWIPRRIFQTCPTVEPALRAIRTRSLNRVSSMSEIPHAPGADALDRTLECRGDVSGHTNMVEPRGLTVLEAVQIRLEQIELISHVATRPHALGNCKEPAFRHVDHGSRHDFIRRSPRYTEPSSALGTTRDGDLADQSPGPCGLLTAIHRLQRVGFAVKCRVS